MTTASGGRSWIFRASPQHGPEFRADPLGSSRFAHEVNARRTLDQPNTVRSKQILSQFDAVRIDAVLPCGRA